MSYPEGKCPPAVVGLQADAELWGGPVEEAAQAVGPASALGRRGGWVMQCFLRVRFACS